jgi:hypothetical protein
MFQKLKKIETRRSKEHTKGWAVVGSKGAVEFHIITSDTHPLVGGVETHYGSPPEYMNNEPPHHTDCPLIGTCWHDGTSLWAEEYWIPLYQKLGEEWVWYRLELLYYEIFPEDPDNEL